MAPAHADLPRPNDDRWLLDALARVPERGGRLVSICSGVFVLAATGVLDGRRATTHWRYTETLARRYPHTIRTEDPWGSTRS